MSDRELTRFHTKEELLELSEDTEVIARYIANLNHPALNDSLTLARSVRDYAGYGEHAATDLREAWRARVREINNETAGLSDDKYDNLVDTTHKDYDEGFAAIVEALMLTRENKDLEEQRKALMLLCDLRVAALRVGANNTEPWVRLAHRLTS